MTYFVAKPIYCVFIVTEKYLRIFARLDLIGKLRSEAAPQVMIAWWGYCHIFV